MAETKTIEAMKSPSGNPVRVEEAWKDANGGLLTDKALKSEVITLEQQEKCYQALKTVTKDFTRTDPVHVRIGADGEPEIHYTIASKVTEQGYFAGMDLPGVTIYVHNCKNLYNYYGLFSYLTYETLSSPKRVILDEMPDGAFDGTYMFYFANETEEIVIPETATFSGAFQQFAHCKKLKISPKFNVTGGNKGSWFLSCYDLKEIRDFDLSLGGYNEYSFFNCFAIAAFHAYGMKASLFLSHAALKHDAILEVFNNLGTANENATLTLGATKLALMSDEEKAIATGKGWTLA